MCHVGEKNVRAAGKAVSLFSIKSAGVDGGSLFLIWEGFPSKTNYTRYYYTKAGETVLEFTRLLDNTQFVEIGMLLLLLLLFVYV